MHNLTVLNHPVITHKICAIRDKTTPSSSFRRLVREVSTHLAFEALRNVPLIPVSVDTPLTTTQSGRVDESSVLFIPILRAGLGLLDGFLELIPDARIAHLGMARDEATLKPREYLSTLDPKCSASITVVLDPMLATGGSAICALEKVMALRPSVLVLACLIAAPEGIKAVSDRFPSVQIVAAAVDECLNEKGFIVPGLGDAGDRLHNS